jgi:hypothetical protein
MPLSPVGEDGGAYREKQVHTDGVIQKHMYALLIFVPLSSTFNCKLCMRDPLW